MGLEPTISSVTGRHVNHYTTGPLIHIYINIYFSICQHFFSGADEGVFPTTTNLLYYRFSLITSVFLFFFIYRDKILKIVGLSVFIFLILLKLILFSNNSGNIPLYLRILSRVSHALPRGIYNEIEVI